MPETPVPMTNDSAMGALEYVHTDSAPEIKALLPLRPVKIRTKSFNTRAMNGLQKYSSDTTIMNF